jgi:hypothetical protein
MTPTPRIAALVLAGSLGLAAAAAMAAELRPSGFYGGIAMREQGAEQGVSIGDSGAARFASAMVDPRASQAMVFGGYRWRNDLALEASFGSIDGYRLPGGGGVGLVAPGSAAAGRTVNVDVVGSWSFWRSFSLYGRLGYAQSDATPVYSTSIAGADPRQRDGLNYGVGLRYDLSRSLGLKLEYARVASPFEASASPLPEADQVQFGLQFRF